MLIAGLRRAHPCPCPVPASPLPRPCEPGESSTDGSGRYGAGLPRAPRAGRLSEVAVREGQLVSPGAQLMYLVPERLWVVANFKEAQTAEIRVGQSATLEIDALGGLELTGKVQSVSPAAGSEFSVIKPDTGAGNFVKVPQRIAVRIRIDPGQRAAQRLGPGMSVIATVHTGDR